MSSERSSDSYDPILAALVSLAYNQTLEISVTLNAGGTTISGLLVGWNRWW